MKKAVPVLAVSAVLIALSALLAPPGWKWPAIGTVFFFGFFITTRIAARAIGEEAEKRFNKPR